VPHAENLSYFGDADEAQMVYQFALPPLVLHAFLAGDAKALREWAQSIRPPGAGRTFFNFCASHDGIGVLPARGILAEDGLKLIFDEVEKRGGFISHKSTPEGEVPYELNINYFSAVAENTLTPGLRARKFAASQSVLLAMPGVPGIYVHSITGSENWREGVEESGIKRRINRQRLDYAAFRKEMSLPENPREEVFSAFERLLSARAAEKAFHPLADFRVLPAQNSAFALLRIRRPEDGKERVLCLVNLLPKEIELSFNARDIGMGEERYFTDIAGGDVFYPAWETEEVFSLTLEAFEVMWLRFTGEA
jgi:sucrose phosphorylase